MHNDKLSQLEGKIHPFATLIHDHPIFSAIRSIEQLRKFTEIHVYAVWDFMCLLKALQRKLTSSELFWAPPADHLGCHLINTMVAEEESDCIEEHHYLSHFELYLEAMQQCGANISIISDFIENIRQQTSPISIFIHQQGAVPKPARLFMIDTFAVIAKKTHEIAASFAFAREHITSSMFSRLINSLAVQQKKSEYSLDKFIYYLNRHIELDGGKHNLQSKILVANLCGEDEQKWQQATDCAIFSLKSRLALLDGIYKHIMAER